jgi:hypothetical protein
LLQAWVRRRLAQTFHPCRKAAGSGAGGLHDGALDELKTHLRGAQAVLLSKTPELVRQEFWGLLLAYFAVRGLLHEAALRADAEAPTNGMTYRRARSGA